MKLKEFKKPTKKEIENYSPVFNGIGGQFGVEITPEISEWPKIKDKLELMNIKAMDLWHYSTWVRETESQRSSRKYPLTELDLKHFRREYAKETSDQDAGIGFSPDYYWGQEVASRFVLTALNKEFLEETKPDTDDESLVKHPDGRIGHIYGGFEDAMDYLRDEEKEK